LGWPASGHAGDSQRIVRLCLMTLAVLGTGSMIGAASVLYLANHFPLSLIALSPIGRHLVLVAPTVHPAPFIIVATLRRLAFYLPCFVLGRTLGAVALGWLETRFRGAARFVRWLERLFQRAPYPAVFLLPGPIMSTIAGKSRMPMPVWISLVASGLLLRMIVIVWFGEWMREPIERLLVLFDEYWIPGTLVLVTGTAIYQWRKRQLVR
jgi:membrane protein DedA with SNARE-associated domain